MLRQFALFTISVFLIACSTPPKTNIVKPMAIPKIGLALGGGGTKGFAHIGAIKVLEAQNLFIDYVGGTSAGSVVGALYASGMNGYALQETSFALDESTLRDFNIFSGSLIKGEKLQNYINELVKNRPLEKLGKPFVAVATDIDSGTPISFARGNTGEAVRASASIPGVFQPVTISGRRYMDGGILSPVPVDAVRNLGADIVIAIDISAKAQATRVGTGPTGIVSQAITIMGQKLGAVELARADVVIRPAVDTMGSGDFEQKNKAILAGEKATQAALPAIREAIRKWQSTH